MRDEAASADPPEVEGVREAVAARLSPARAAHSQRVAAVAERLAALHGLPAADARLAGLLHDWCREEPEGVLLREARALGVPLPGRPDQVVAATLHGPVAARQLPLRWPTLPPRVLQAIDCHTTGDPAMTAFDCLVFLADAVEPAHAYPGVDALRVLAEQDLGAACARALGRMLANLLGRGRPVDPRAVAAHNALLARAPG